MKPKKQQPNSSKAKGAKRFGYFDQKDVKATSWGGVASWYDEYLQQDKTYQSKIIWPNLDRIMLDIKNELSSVLKGRGPIACCDVACGQGLFAYTCAQKGFFTTGIDVSPELIQVANQSMQYSSALDAHVSFHVAPSHDMPMIKTGTQEIVTCVLALQNIKLLDETMQEVCRILKTDGRFLFVINHPSFRVPQYSDWYFDEQKKIQSRLVSKYMQETTVKIDMNPGERLTHKKIHTISFHRPLQTFVKLLAKHGFLIKRLEEWGSHKRTSEGSRRDAENLARKEIPMFMCLEAIKKI